MAADPHRRAEREIEKLEEQLAATDDPEERRAIRRDMRDIEREVGDYERWEDEGRERGWRN
jgi:hypothetical protein